MIRYFYQIETAAQKQEWLEERERAQARLEAELRKEKPQEKRHKLQEALRDERKRIAMPILYDGVLPGDPRYLQDAVGRANYCAPSVGWQQATKLAIESVVSNIVDNYSLIALFGDPRNPPTAQSGILQELATTARNQAWARTSEWGVCVTSIDILHVQVPQAVQDRILAMWKAEAESDSMIRKSQGEVAAFSAFEGVRTSVAANLADDFYNALNRAFQSLPVTVLPVYLSILSRIAEEVGKDRVAAYRYFQTLQAMSENPNTTVIINTPDEPNNPIIVEPKKKT